MRATYSLELPAIENYTCVIDAFNMLAQARRTTVVSTVFELGTPKRT